MKYLSLIVLFALSCAAPKYGDSCSSSSGKTGVVGTNGDCMTCSSGTISTSGGSGCSAVVNGTACCAGGGGYGTVMGCSPATGCVPPYSWYGGGHCYSTSSTCAAGGNSYCRQCY